MNELIKDYLIDQINNEQVHVDILSFMRDSQTEYLVTYIHKHEESNVTYILRKNIDLQDLLVFMYNKIKK